MDINTTLNEKLSQLQHIKDQLLALQEKIGALQEEGRAIHMSGLELKGQIEMLAQMKASQDEALKESKTAQLILPEGTKPVLEVR